jgi:topoisomerase-4 subunit A
MSDDINKHPETPEGNNEEPEKGENRDNLS